MHEKIVFLRRTEKEIEVFGGDVYIDINGRNVGILGTEEFVYHVKPGRYVIKMYKSHTFNSFIGHAESDLILAENEQLLVKYSPPMLLNQHGSIIVSEFTSHLETEKLAEEKDAKIILDQNVSRQRQTEQEEQSRNGIIIFVLLTIVTSILIYALSFAELYSY